MKAHMQERRIFGGKSASCSKNTDTSSNAEKVRRKRKNSIVYSKAPIVFLKEPKVTVKRFSCFSKTGYDSRMEKQNQDSIILRPGVSGNDSYYLFGVADGHGHYGREVSGIIKEKYPVLFERNLKSLSCDLMQSLKSQDVSKIFAITSTQLDDWISKEIPDIELSGSTCVIVYINEEEMYTANIGDSRAILGKLKGYKGTFIS
eukprot:TRINITY_DN10197_c0_g2_i1.p2 TRINITY_DN10197_c0_g2~~TRINITY_DN10197_c0_g2_i1.p2  ORF type:complete len:203 (+),score=28.74 TRINITY_DN10197_c0_g2_i1:771-1379(+)